MARSAFQAYITNPDDGGVLDGAQLSVTYEAGGTATIYEQQVGGTTKANPFTIGTDGKAVFYAEPGLYRITATQGGITSEFRNYRIGVYSNELNDITSLSSLNTAALVDGQQFDRREWWPGTGVGGSKEIWDPNMPVSMHNGGTIKDPAKISELNTTAKTFGTYFTPDTVSGNMGCFVVEEVDVVSAHIFGTLPAAPDNYLPIQKALDSALSIRLEGNGTFIISQAVVLPAGGSLIGTSRTERATVKIANGADSNVIYSTASNISIKNLIVDGNKTNQTLGVPIRGIYFQDTADNFTLTGVKVQNVLDHSVFFSNCGKNSRIKDCEVVDGGLQAHVDAGGPGGSGFVGGQPTTVWTGCFASGNLLNGFKASGEFIGCDSEDNIGGGWETGFSTPEFFQTRYLGCSARRNGGAGWRHFGQGNWLTKVACIAERNGEAGVAIVNSVKKVTMEGCWFIENGQAATKTRGDTTGYDGVFISATTGTPEDVVITGCQFIDEQVTHTQDYHIYIGKPTGNVTIDASNVFDDGALIQALFIAFAAAESPISIGNARGLDTFSKIDSVSTLTGTITPTNLASRTVRANSSNTETILSVVARGAFSGTTGTKTVRMFVGGTSIVIVSRAAGNTDDWYLEASITRQIGSPGLFIRADIWNVIAGTLETKSFFVGISLSSDVVIRIEGELGSASDSATLTQFKLKAG